MAELKVYAKPQYLYRYRPLGEKIDQELTAIAENFIYCPSYSAMNDPMEGLYRMSLRYSKNPNSSKSREKVQSALTSMGIASLSEVFDHEPMWAHYAGQFSGMCVQYSFNALLKGLSSDIAVTRMMYAEKEPVLLEDNSSVSDRARLCLSSKSIRWASEREWRLFKAEQGAANYSGDSVTKKIFLGSRVSERDEKRVLSLARRMRITVMKMEIEAYAVEFNRIYQPIRTKPK